MDRSVERHALKNVASRVSNNVPVLLNGTVHTQTLSPHMCPSAFTLGHMSLNKLLDMLSNLRPCVKALLNVVYVLLNISEKCYYLDLA